MSGIPMHIRLGKTTREVLKQPIRFEIVNFVLSGENAKTTSQIVSAVTAVSERYSYGSILYHLKYLCREQVLQVNKSGIKPTEVVYSIYPDRDILQDDLRELYPQHYQD